jgi:hypothetical protein
LGSLSAFWFVNVFSLFFLELRPQAGREFFPALMIDDALATFGVARTINFGADTFFDIGTGHNTLLENRGCFKISGF